MAFDISTSKRRSLFVTIPTSFPPSTTGKLLIPNALLSSLILVRLSVEEMVVGLLIIQCSARFTFSTSAAWFSAERFLCITPIPPSRASAAAVACSVTVSIAALTIGMFRVILGVILVRRETSFGSTLEAAGTTSTSSKVSAYSLGILSLPISYFPLNGLKGLRWGLFRAYHKCSPPFFPPPQSQ